MVTVDIPQGHYRARLSGTETGVVYRLAWIDRFVSVAGVTNDSEVVDVIVGNGSVVYTDFREAHCLEYGTRRVIEKELVATIQDIGITGGTVNSHELDDGDGNALTRQYVVPMTTGGSVSVACVLDPSWANQFVPDCFSFTGGLATSNQLVRLVPTDLPGEVDLYAAIGTNWASVKVFVLKVDLIWPDIGQEVDDQDGNPNTRVFVVFTNSGDVTVTADITPNLSENQLPSCMTLQGITGSESLTRTVSRATPSKTVFTFDYCGRDSGLITTLYVYETKIGLFADEGARNWEWPWENVGHSWWTMSADAHIQELLNPLEQIYANEHGGFWPSITNDPFCSGVVKLNTDAAGGHYITGLREFQVTFNEFRAALDFFINRHASPYYYNFFDYNCTDAAVEQGEWGNAYSVDAGGVTTPKELSDWLNSH